MNHYETLGLQPDASAGEIKAAFRLLASKAHPDRGGSAEQMAALNVAYAVLSDPERRARYDQSGQDGQPKTVDDLAADNLRVFFAAALRREVPDVLVAAFEMVDMQLRELMETMRTESGLRARLLRRREKYVGWSEPNLVLEVIDAQVLSIDEALEQCKSTMKINAAAGKLLTRYQIAQRAADLDHSPMPACSGQHT